MCMLDVKCIYVLAEYLKYYAFKGIVILFGKIRVALSEKSRLLCGCVWWLRQLCLCPATLSTAY